MGFQHYRHIDDSGAASPANSSPRRVNPSGGCIHATAGSNSLSWLLAGSAAHGEPASANYLIERDGTRHKLCDDKRFPYSAGQSRCFLDNGWRYGDEISERLLSYELECLWSEAPTWWQVDSLADQIVEDAARWRWRWPFILYGHYGIALPAGRRSDPWLLDWGSLMGRLYVRAQAVGIGGL